MKYLIRKFKNFFYSLQQVKIIDESIDKIKIQCRKCGSTLEIHKKYGKMNIVCKCGHIMGINTGPDLHKYLGKKDYSSKETPPTQKVDKIKTDKFEIFYKHINKDLQDLYIILNDRRNVIEQADYDYCIKLLHKKNEINIEVVRYLQKFLDLEEASINIIWELLDNKNTLSDSRVDINILGTTYTLPMGRVIFYSIYLNLPKLVNNKELILATIAHELTHVYVSYNNIKLSSPGNDRGDKEYNEQMTDLLGIVLGMGKFISAPSNERESYNTGYLTHDMIRDSYNRWNNDFLSGKNKIIKVVTECENCDQKVRIPINRQGLIITCPKCKNSL